MEIDKIEKAGLLARMNEIIDVINFLAREGVCKDMQREIMSYFNRLEYIDVLIIGCVYGGEYEEIYRENIVYVLDRKDFTPIVIRIFEIFKSILCTIDNYVINNNKILVNDTSYSIEKIAKKLKKYGSMYSKSNPYPFDKISCVHRKFQVTFTKEIVKFL